jgi:serine/threonine protein kinase
VLSTWHNAWLAADPDERVRLRAALADDRPDLAAEADALAVVSVDLRGFLETPALILASQDLAQDDRPFAEEAMVGPYRIVGLLARGGMGDVYRATDVRLHRDVALKVLAHDDTGDPLRGWPFGPVRARGDSVRGADRRPRLRARADYRHALRDRSRNPARRNAATA